LIKKGVLKATDTFVCGLHEGKVRFIKDDDGKNISEAFPGQAVHIGGFKVVPEAGNPLYCVENHKEANMIV
jgi:translation initiation factor IF-2